MKRKIVTTMPVLTIRHMCLMAEGCNERCNPRKCTEYMPRTLHPALFELVMAWADYRKLNIDEVHGVLPPRLERMDDAVLAVTSWDVRKI